MEASRESPCRAEDRATAPQLGLREVMITAPRQGLGMKLRMPAGLVALSKISR
jgi:hypothetical protein